MARLKSKKTKRRRARAHAQHDGLLEWHEGQATALLSVSSLGGLEEVDDSVAAYWTAEEPPNGTAELATPAGMEIPPPQVAPREVIISPPAGVAPPAPKPDAAPDVPRAAPMTPAGSRRTLRRLGAVAGVIIVVAAVAFALPRQKPAATPTQPFFDPVRVVEATAAVDLPALLQGWAVDNAQSQQIRDQFAQVNTAVANKVAALPFLPADHTLAALAVFAPDEETGRSVARLRLERVVDAVSDSIRHALDPPEGVAEVAAELETYAAEYPHVVASHITADLDFDLQDAVRYALAEMFDNTAAAELLQAERSSALYSQWRGQLTDGGVLAAATFIRPRLAQRNGDQFFASHLPTAIADAAGLDQPEAHAFALAALRDVYYDDPALARAHAAATEEATLATLRAARDSRAVALYRARSEDPARTPAPRFLVDVLDTAERALPLERQLALYAAVERDAAFPEQQVIADHRTEVLIERARQAVADGSFALSAVQWHSDVAPRTFGELLQIVYPVVEEGVAANKLDTKAMRALIRHARAAEETELATRLVTLRDRTWPPKAEVKEPIATEPEVVPRVAVQPKPKVASATLHVSGPAEGHTKITARLVDPAGKPVANAHVQVQLNVGGAKAHSFVAQTDGEGVSTFNVTRYIVSTRDLPPTMKFNYRVSTVERDAKPVDVTVTVGELVDRFW